MYALTPTLRKLTDSIWCVRTNSITIIKSYADFPAWIRNERLWNVKMIHDGKLRCDFTLYPLAGFKIIERLLKTESWTPTKPINRKQRNFWLPQTLEKIDLLVLFGNDGRGQKSKDVFRSLPTCDYSFKLSYRSASSFFQAFSFTLLKCSITFFELL